MKGVFFLFEKIYEEFEKKFKPKKNTSLLLSESYERLGMSNKAFLTRDCGSLLDYKKSSSGDFKLFNANFCKNRLCPMCNWRRSLKIFNQVSNVVQYIENCDEKYEYIFLTLTVVNCSADKLNETLDNMQKAFHRFINRKRVKTAVHGYIKSLEITRNNKTGEYHPHYHCVLAVKPEYFKHLDYISHSEWLELWKQSMRDNRITQVDVRKCYNNKKDLSKCSSFFNCVAEISKYAAKSKDYIFPDNPDLTDKIISELSTVLTGRRLISFGGIFNDARKALELDDAEDGNLINVDGDNSEYCDDSIYRFLWRNSEYILSYIITPEYTINAITGEIIDDSGG